ncbi:DUF4468 domain-containing protein [Litoribacillus peritrichatus]|uniref:DUF4468 domain-containing protein n=1 Tax=Litoribacillus peritrichatus TaxID=718191 RepID=A0ABP7M0K6_9GAMM
MSPIKPVFLLWLSFLLAACAAQPFREPISATTIIEIPNAKKEALFQRTEIWMKENFKIGDSEVVMTEPKQARIIGKNKSMLWREVGLVFYVWYSLKVETKDGKIRVTSTITDTTFVTTNDMNSHHSYMDDKIIKSANQHIQNTINQLVNNLKQPTLKSDW